MKMTFIVNHPYFACEEQTQFQLLPEFTNVKQTLLEFVEKFKKMEERLIVLEYAPPGGGPEYLKASDHFTENVNKCHNAHLRKSI